MSCTRCQRLEDEVARLSVDALTGLSGRGVFDRALETEFARACRFNREIGLVMIDVDHFKSVNDDHGHVRGDEVLRTIAGRVQAYVRTCDVIARYGGEEFVILTDGATLVGLEVISERVRMAVCDKPIDKIRATISVGFAVQIPSDVTGLDVLKRADSALYRAKNNGRNCVEGCDSAEPPRK